MKAKRLRVGSVLEQNLCWWITQFADMPLPHREYRFHPVRMWRFDFAYPEIKLAIECEGGTWANGRHNRGSGFEEDCAKYNQAALLGWRVLRFTKSMIDSGQAIHAIRTAIT